MPPPDDDALHPEMTEFLMTRLTFPTLPSIPPPTPAILPPLMVRLSISNVLDVATLNTRLMLFALMFRFPDPGPVRVSPTVMDGRADVNVIVPLTPVRSMVFDPPAAS